MSELDLAMFDGLHVTKIVRTITQVWEYGGGPRTEETVTVQFSDHISDLSFAEWDKRFNAAGYDVREWRSEFLGRNTVTLVKVTKP